MATETAAGNSSSPSAVRARRLVGPCLHSGRQGALSIERCPGPLAIRREGVSVAVEDLRVLRADHGVAVRLGAMGPTVDLIEHLCAALGGLGVRRGLRIDLETAEVPVLDGSAAALAKAIGDLSPPADLPTLRVARPGEVTVGDSRYRFAEDAGVQLAVTTVFPGAIGVQMATWNGDAGRFQREIAPARTFGFARDRDAMMRRGRALGADPSVVMVFDDTGRVVPPGEPMRDEEVARHKLLDLVGDLYLHGGPPLGRVEAYRPGHRATHAAVSEALTRGILVRGIVAQRGRDQ